MSNYAKNNHLLNKILSASIELRIGPLWQETCYYRRNDRGRRIPHRVWPK